MCIFVSKQWHKLARWVNSPPQANFLRFQGLFMRISKAKMSAADEILRAWITDTISMCLQFLRFGNCEFITISTDQQFLRLSFSETVTISTLHNFNGRAQRALEKIRYNFDRFAIYTFLFLQNVTISTLQQFLRFWKYSFVAISTG